MAKKKKLTYTSLRDNKDIHSGYEQALETGRGEFGQHHKKDERSIEEAIGHLKDMQNILIPSKAEEMQPHIEKMERAREIIFRGELSFANKDYVRSIIEREDRAIKREFCYNKVKDSLRKSFDEEAPPQLSMPAGKEAHGGSEK